MDDDPRVLDMLKVLLERDGYIIESATGAEIALRKVHEFDPDVVVLDVFLPDSDGITVCRQIKEAPETRFLPVVLVTGDKDREHKLAGLNAGADDFLPKPFDPLELIVRVRSLLRTKQLYETVEAQRRELEQRVAERTRELQQAYERLQSLSRVKSNVLQIVSHELRTPLHQAQAALNLLLQESVAEEQRRTLLQTVVDKTRQLEYRVGDVEAFADPGDLRLAPTSVNALVASAIAQVDFLGVIAGAKIVADVPPGLPAVMVHATPMTRALAHVIHNGVKFGNGKPVKVTARRVDTGIYIEVRDEGDGIAEDQIPRLLEPLTQGEEGNTRRHGGLGIGLALVKMVLDEHSITLEIHSKQGEGTTLAFILPFAEL